MYVWLPVGKWNDRFSGTEARGQCYCSMCNKLLFHRHTDAIHVSTAVCPLGDSVVPLWHMRCHWRKDVHFGHKDVYFPLYLVSILHPRDAAVNHPSLV
jgi:hypothetical protein